MVLGNLSTCERHTHDMLGASFAAMIEGVSVSEAAFAVAVVGGFVFAIDGEG